MKKQISVTINSYDIKEYLRGRGVNVPDMATLTARENVDGDSIDISWSEDCKWEGSVSTDTRNMLDAFCKTNQRIAAIKELRFRTGWGLRESKDYIDHNYPQK